MKKLCAFLLVLSLALGSMAAFAENIRPVKFELSLHLEPEVMPMQPDAMDLFGLLGGIDGKALMEAHQQWNESVAALLNLITMTGESNGNETNVSINLKGKSLFSVQEGTDADGQTVVTSNLFPSYVITFSEEEMIEYSNQDVSARLMDAVEEAAAPMLQIIAETGLAVNGHVQESKTGTFEVAGNMYDQYTRYEMTTEECWAIVNKASAQMIPLLEKMLVALGVEEDVEAMEEAMADMQDAPMPEYLKDGIMRTETYLNSENQLMFYETVSLETAQVNAYITLTMNGCKVEFYGISGPVTYADQAALEQAAADNAPDVFQVKAAAEMDLAVPVLSVQAEITDGEAYQRHELKGFNTEEDTVVRYQYYQQKDGQPLAEVVLKFRYMDELHVTVDTEGKKAISYTEIMNAVDSVADPEEEDGDYSVLMNLAADVSKAGNGMLIQAILAAPEEVQALLDAETALSNAYLYSIPSYDDLDPIEVPDDGVAF